MSVDVDAYGELLILPRLEMQPGDGAQEPASYEWS